MLLNRLDDAKREIIRYFLIGILTTMIGLGTYKGCVSTFLNVRIAWELQLANVLSWVTAVLFAYIMNRNYVFKVEESWFYSMIKFFLSRVGTLLLEMFIMFVGVTVIGIQDMLVKLATQGVVIIANYLLGKFWVFQKNK